MVAEKPSIALSITEALSSNYKSRKSKKYNSLKPSQSFLGGAGLPVYEFDGEFLGTYASLIVTSVAGHVFNRDFPEKYSDWKAVEPEALFDVETVRNSADPKVLSSN